ncbi:HEAT repeat domain-containing protein [Pantoea sp. Acro-805]|jgi:hypothetical protein|uniref:HEAT repeat domain-containing protein n=1 Tax=Candidatus Pantoea formicae TaxID=2608355 RepID=A0ABX0R0K9_9GAMM|nr:HEAT repeat domain-containing protein [Pantoea formicae]MDF7647058.1 HEAT repeat domain-containing protein [Erwiniaceae bacterium L1_54_3]NIF01101.1 HEAT repeat domain-containing protein [Pantoea formicae]
MIRSAKEFVLLRESDDPFDYRRAAEEEATEEIWLDVIRNYPNMKSWVAHNKTVPLEILNVLANDVDPDVRYSVAMKKKLSLEIFKRLASDEDYSVRLCIAKNKKAPSSILEMLSNDPEEDIKNLANENFSKIKTK